MIDYSALQQAIERALGDSVAEPRPARLGNPTLPVTSNRIDVPLSLVDTPGMVWIHGLGEDPQSVSMALNSGPGAVTQKIYGDFILVKKQRGVWVVAGNDYQAQAEYRYGVTVRDQTSVVLGQFDFGLLKPTSPDRSMKAVVSKGIYYVGNVPYAVQAQETQNFTSDIPGTAGEARAVLVTIDPTTGDLAYTAGSTFDATLTHETAFTTYYPQNSDNDLFTAGWVRLTNGMTAVFENVNIYPAQELISKGGSGAAVTVEDFFCGRLTLSSGVPVTVSDVIGSTHLYLTPYNGNRMTLYNSLTTLWQTVTFTEIDIPLSGLTADAVYDVFVYLDAGAAAAEVLIWSSTTARATAIATVDGRDVKSGDTTRRLAGTFQVNSVGGQSEVSLTKMLVCNRYNLEPREMRFDSPDAGWTYSGGWRQANGSTNYQLQYVSCLNRQVVDAQLDAVIAVDGGTGGAVGIGMDSPSVRVARRHIQALHPNPGMYIPVSAGYRGRPGVGSHKLLWLETADGGTPFFMGNDVLRENQSSLMATVYG
jgi:hypothetical protein